MRARELFAQCLDQLEARVKECVEAGGDPEDCKERAIKACRERINEFLVACLKECRDVPEPPEPPTCRERCVAAAGGVKRECLADGGSEDECAARVEEFLVRCAGRCEQPEPPNPCDFDCAGAAERVAAQCVEAGGDPEECGAKAREFLSQCQDRLAEHCAQEGIAAGLALTPYGGYSDFVRGDFNRDAKVDMSDMVGGLVYLFQGGPAPTCPDAADINDDSKIDISDMIFGLNYLFTGGAAIPAPLGEPGQDLTFDSLICD